MCIRDSYWDEKIKRNIARDDRQNGALTDAGWRVLRFWEFEVEHDPDAIADAVRYELEAVGLDPSTRS